MKARLKKKTRPNTGKTRRKLNLTKKIQDKSMMEEKVSGKRILHHEGEETDQVEARLRKKTRPERRKKRRKNSYEEVEDNYCSFPIQRPRNRRRGGGGGGEGKARGCWWKRRREGGEKSEGEVEEKEKKNKEEEETK